MMEHPSYMSLPSAAAMPITRLGFSYTAERRLISKGIVSALQLAEIASRSPRHLKHLTGVSATKALRVLEAEFGSLPDFRNIAVSFDPVPEAGVPAWLPPSGGPVSTAVSRSRLLAHLESLGDLPTRVSLAPRMQPVGNQGPHGTCVGWSANAVREHALEQPMSPGYAYRGAKSRDGHPGIQGSWLVYAMEHLFQTGHVSETAYSYQSAVRGEPIDILAKIAAPARSIGFASLTAEFWSLDHLPRLMRALLAGRFSPGLGPQPVAIALVLHPSFISTSTALDGLIPMPFPDEEKLGGHAMTVVGYIDAADPENPFGLSYFTVRNSWGAIWAGENPFGAPGHAMIPEAYFRNPALVIEAYVCLGGP